MSESIVLIKAAQTRKYGSVEQTYSAEVTVVAESYDKIQAAYKYLNNMLAAEFQSFENGYMPRTNSVPAGSDLEEWEGGVFKKVVDGNQVKYKLETGQYQKFGVPVYPEKLDQFPDFPDGVFALDMTGWRGQLHVVNGKPKRVMTCSRAQ